jgi:uncharacterized protein YbaA (DUF1428 family)
MMSYVDEFVLPVPKRKVAAYFAMTQKAGKVWMDHGALGFFKVSRTTCRTASAHRFRAA